MCITSRRALDEDVRVVIWRLGKQIGKSCPRIVQLCLVVESINRNGRALFVVGNGDAPEGSLAATSLNAGAGLPSTMRFLRVETVFVDATSTSNALE
ncbi:hypothetical protein BGZ95_008902, partial [Linnemannia exigua]